MQRTILGEIIARNNMNDRGMKKADFHMLRETSMDAAFTENGFIDNGGDAAKMKNPEWIECVARGHVVGLEKIFNLTKNKSAPASSAPAATLHLHLLLQQTEPTIYLHLLKHGEISCQLSQLERMHRTIENVQIRWTYVFNSAIGREPQTYIINTADFERVKIYGHPSTGTVVRLFEYLS